MGGLYPGSGFLGAYSFGSIIEDAGDEVTTEDAYFRRTITSEAGPFARTVTGDDAPFARTVTTQDTER